MYHERYRAILEPCRQRNNLDALLLREENGIRPDGAKGIGATGDQLQRWGIWATGIQGNIQAGVAIVALDLGHNIASELILGQPLKADRDLANFGCPDC